MRKTVFCPICKTEQNIYCNRVVKHIITHSIVCVGSNKPLDKNGNPPLKKPIKWKTL